MKFSRKQAAKMLGVSLRTLDRHIKAAKITVERNPAADFEQAVTISLEALGSYLGITDQELLRERLGLPQESAAKFAAPAPEPSVADSARHPEPAPQPELSPVDKQLEADREFAAAYRAGLITDSFGNTIYGGEGTSALGPRADLCIGYSPDSRRDPRYQPIRFHQPSRQPAVQRKSGYGVTEQDIADERAALAARRFSR